MVWLRSCKSSCPPANAEQFRGDPGFGLWPIIAADGVPVPAFRLGLNAGYRWNSGRSPTMPFQGRIDPVTNPADASKSLLFPEKCQTVNGADITNAVCPGETQHPHPVRYDDVITFGAAASLRFAKSAELVGEFYGTQQAKAIGDKGGLGAEAIGGLKIYVEANSYLLLAAQLA